MHIEPLDPHSTEAQALIEVSDAYFAALYPSDSNHLESVQRLAQPNVHFLGAFVDGKLAACGGVKTLAGDDSDVCGEIKRLFVLQQHRGKGLSKAIMQRLEAHLMATGVRVARLETGVRQPEALRLYSKLGYVRRPPFAGYVDDQLSVFMEKRLA
jgi:putative acetyltransferase